MRLRTKLCLAGLLAALTMTLVVTAASASRLSLSNRNIRITWTSLDLVSGGSTVEECPLTLEGSFHSATIRKTAGALIGFISRASVGVCFGGTKTILQASLPWHITYDSFTGALPRPSGLVLLLHRLNWQATVLGVNCLYGEDGVERARATLNIEPNGLVTGLTPDPNIALPLLSGSFFCPEEINLGETGRVRLLGSTTQNILVRLI